MIRFKNLFDYISAKRYLKIHLVFLILAIILFIISYFFGYTFYGKLIDRIIIYGYLFSLIYCLFKKKENFGIRFYSLMILSIPIVIIILEPLIIFMFLVNLFGGGSYSANDYYEVRFMPSPFTHQSYEILERKIIFEKQIGTFTSNEINDDFQIQIDLSKNEIKYKSIENQIIIDTFKLSSD